MTDIYGCNGQLIATESSLQGIRIERLEHELDFANVRAEAFISAIFDINMTPAQQRRFDASVKRYLRQYLKRRSE